MKQQTLYRGAMTLICSTILAACGSSGGSLAIEKVPNTPSAAELEQAKQAATLAEQKLSEAQNDLNKANQKLQDAQANGKTQASELAKLKQDLENAENAKKDANQKLQDAQANGKTQADELAKLKQDLVNAENAKTEADAAAKKAADDLAAEKQKATDELAKAKQEAEENLKTEVEKAKKTAVENYLTEQNQKVIKTEMEKAFGGADKSLPSENGLNTNVISIKKDHTPDTSTTYKAAELHAITINGVEIPLLKKEVEENSKQNLALKTFNKEELPTDAKAVWVGSLGKKERLEKQPNKSPEFGAMRFGAYVDKNDVTHLFVHGKPSSEYAISSAIKHGEIYTYQGSAIIGKDGNYTPLANAITGQVSFKDKKVDLNLAADKDTNYKLTGNIEGNTFSGTSEDGVWTKGGFYNYGDNLGGVLQINDGKYSGYNGVYGAGEVNNITPK